MGTPVKLSDLANASALGGTETVIGKQGTGGSYGGNFKIAISQIGTYVRGLFTTTPATIAEGGTNAATAAAARTSLGSTTVGDAVFVAATKAAANTAIGSLPQALAAAAGDIIQASGVGAWAKLAIGTIGQVPTVNAGATALAYATPTAVGTPVATTSGSTVNLSTTLPAGIRRIILGFNAVSSNGTAKYQVQLSTGGVFATTGYVGANAAANFSGGFDIQSGSAANAWYGIVTLYLIDTATNTWGYSSNLVVSGSAGIFPGTGIVPLSGVVDGVRITSSDTWDAGSISVSYGY